VKRGVIAALSVLVPLAAAAWGSLGPLRLVLNLGPGDTPYLAGFLPEWEIDEKVATHWSTTDARIELPLVVRGGPAAVSYRYARVLPETAVVEVSLAGNPVDRFTCRGGRFDERRVALGALRSGTPVRVRFEIDSHDERKLGLRFDWVSLETGRARLAGGALLRPALLVVIVLAILHLAGLELAAGAAALLGLTLAAGLLGDPWLVHRLLTGVPETLALFGIPAVLVARRGGVAAADLRVLGLLCVTAFLIRAAAVNHPDFYYPDLKTHASLVRIVRAAGLDFFVHPAQYIWEHGVWRTEAGGRTYAFPYSPAFHLPFVALGLSMDATMTAMKLWAALVSVVPIVLVWALARFVGSSTLGALLMVLVPTYTSRLSFAFLPALFGHAFDMALLLWLARSAERLPERRSFVIGALFVSACQLAYVSGVINTCMLIVSLAALFALRGRPDDRRRALSIAAFGLLGAVLSVALYYRDFLGMAVDSVSRAAGPAAVSRYAVRSFFVVAFERTRDFFGYALPPLSLLGLGLLWRRRAPGALALLAAFSAYALLLLGRAKLPDLFLHGHETLFIAPLVCLGAGEALARVEERAAFGRAGLALALAGLGAWGLAAQWAALRDQLGNAL